MTAQRRPLLEWTPALSVLEDTMDAEHQRLISLMNALYEHNERGSDKTSIGRAFTELLEYTRVHFADEERFMASVSYPDLANHAQAHKHLLLCVELQAREFADGNGKVPSRVFDFFKSWLTSHILGADVKYGHHSRAHKTPEAEA